MDTSTHAPSWPATRYVADAVTSIDRSSGHIRSVGLASGAEMTTETIVTATGAFSAAMGDMVGIEISVSPVRQQLFRCVLPQRWPYRFPVVVDPTGVHWRHEDPDGPDDSDRLIVARTKSDESSGENFLCDMSRWEPDFRAPMVTRVPALEDVRLLEGWAGLYEMTPDHNPLVGEHPDLPGFYLATGFSGHGLMMAPGVGHTVSQLILTRQSSIDVSPFEVTRFTRGELFWDDAMI